MSDKRILFAHERSVISDAVSKVLASQGFEVDVVALGQEALDRAAAQHAAGAPYDGYVTDVALPDLAAYELIAPIREHGVKVVILVASVYRRTSYKRRPPRLYGADDYVEVHHLGDQLPDKLHKHLGLDADSVDEVQAATAQSAADTLREEGDQRLAVHDPSRRAALIIADLVLYNGDVLTSGLSFDEVEAKLLADLEGARTLFAAFEPVEGGPADPVGAAFEDMMSRLAREHAS